MIIVKVIGVFAVVGLGLGAGVLLFLWYSGFFEAAQSQDLGEALGSAIAGGIAIATVLVFALLIGVVMAAFGGMYAANVLRNRSDAVVSAALAGALGHAALVATLGLLLVVGMGVLSPRTESTASETASSQDTAACIDLFGEDSPICQADEGAGTTTRDEVNLQDLWAVALGVIPSGVVGGLGAAILFSKRGIRPMMDGNA